MCFLAHGLQVIIHIAATVKFQERLKLALKLNIYGVRHVITLAKCLQKCDALVHTSTAYTHTYKSVIGEEFYDPTYDVDTLIKLLDMLTDEQAEAVTAATIKPHPNTYTFTKCLGEGLIRAAASEIPVCVVRPAIVISAWKEPHKGWTDTLNGPAGLATMLGIGLFRSVQATASVRPAFIPIDTVANYLLVAPWDVAVRGNTGRMYNCVGQENKLSWGDFADKIQTHFRNNPLSQVIRYPSLVIFPRDSYTFGQKLHTFWNLVCHQTPVMIAEFASWASGHKVSRLGREMAMAQNLVSEYDPWLNNEWDWENNYQDEIMKVGSLRRMHLL